MGDQQVKNKVVREVIDFVRSHQLLFDQILQEDLSDADDLTMEQINLVVGILTKVHICVQFVCYTVFQVDFTSVDSYIADILAI